LTTENAPDGQMPLRGRIAVLVTAFLGWMFAGTIMSITFLALRAATIDLLGSQDEGLVGNWLSRYTCAFLLGGAAGGLVFGWVGDRLGRARAMGLSILCYSIVTGLTWFVQSSEQLLVLRFIACMGVGGMWPNGISLVSEAWSGVSRPLLAGLIGASANVGFVLLAVTCSYVPATPESWRWVLLAASTPAVLGVVVLVIVPESPRWLAGVQDKAARSGPSPAAEVFRPPLLKLTLIGICLGTIPLLGNWGGGNWLVPWADKVGEGLQDPALKGWTQTARSVGGVLGALAGGWLASLCGRRKTYFVVSLLTLATTAYVFRYVTPADGSFLYWVFVVGFVGTVYFGWLPLYLPELFPTRVRATGSGVTFNFGRIATAVGVLGTGQLMTAFEGEYARVGQVTCLVYALGMLIICFAPDTSKRQLED